MDTDQVLRTCNLCSDYMSKLSLLDVLGCSVNRSIDRQNLMRVDHTKKSMCATAILVLTKRNNTVKQH